MNTDDTYTREEAKVYLASVRTLDWGLLSNNQRYGRAGFEAARDPAKAPPYVLSRAGVGASDTLAPLMKKRRVVKAELDRLGLAREKLMGKIRPQLNEIDVKRIALLKQITELESQMKPAQKRLANSVKLRATLAETGGAYYNYLMSKEGIAQLLSDEGPPRLTGGPTRLRRPAPAPNPVSQTFWSEKESDNKH